MSDEIDSQPPPAEPTYPEGTLGDLLRQSDLASAAAERAHGMAAIFTAQAEEAEALVARLDATIAALTLTPSKETF